MQNNSQQKVTLQGIHMQGAQMQGTQIQGTHMQGTQMQGTHIQGTQMQGTPNMIVPASSPMGMSMQGGQTMMAPPSSPLGLPVQGSQSVMVSQSPPIFTLQTGISFSPTRSTFSSVAMQQPGTGNDLGQQYRNQLSPQIFTNVPSSPIGIPFNPNMFTVQGGIQGQNQGHLFTTSSPGGTGGIQQFQPFILNGQQAAILNTIPNNSRGIQGQGQLPQGSISIVGSPAATNISQTFFSANQPQRIITPTPQGTIPTLQTPVPVPTVVEVAPQVKCDKPPESPVSLQSTPPPGLQTISTISSQEISPTLQGINGNNDVTMTIDAKPDLNAPWMTLNPPKVDTSEVVIKDVKIETIKEEADNDNDVESKGKMTKCL